MSRQNEPLKNITDSFNYFQKTLKKSGAASLSSYSLLASILLGVLVGWYFDEKNSSSPFGVLIGLFIGLCVGFYQLAKSIWHK